MAKKALLHMRVHEWMKDELEEYAEREHTTVTEVVERAVEEYLRPRNYVGSKPAEAYSDFDKTDPKAYDALPESRKKELLDWISEKIAPSDTYPEWPQAGYTYALKHIAAHDIGYMTSGEFNGAMLASGYLPQYYRNRNWRFKITGRK